MNEQMTVKNAKQIMIWEKKNNIPFIVLQLRFLNQLLFHFNPFVIAFATFNDLIYKLHTPYSIIDIWEILEIFISFFIIQFILNAYGYILINIGECL